MLAALSFYQLQSLEYKVLDIFVSSTLVSRIKLVRIGRGYKMGDGISDGEIDSQCVCVDWFFACAWALILVAQNYHWLNSMLKLPLFKAGIGPWVSSTK